MDERTTGIILRTRPLTESSLIVQWLTRDFGRLATVAKGARRAKSPFSGKLDLFYLADFSFQTSRRGDLHTLREVNVREYHRGLRSDLAYLHQSSYVVQLLELTTEMNTPLLGLFELVVEVVAFIPRSVPRALTMHGFEMKLLTELGLQPDLSGSALTSGALRILEQVGTSDFLHISRLRASAAQAEEIETCLGRFILDQFGRVPKVRAAALLR
jgi:DNA repair protein RecO (recombination protein O)